MLQIYEEFFHFLLIFNILFDKFLASNVLIAKALDISLYLFLHELPPFYLFGLALDYYLLFRDNLIFQLELLQDLNL